MRLQHLIVGIVVAAAAGVPAVVLAQDRGMSTQQEQPRVEDTLSSQSGLSVNVERPTQPYRVLWPGHLRRFQWQRMNVPAMHPKGQVYLSNHCKGPGRNIFPRMSTGNSK